MSGGFVRGAQLVAKIKEIREAPLKPFRRWQAFSQELRNRDDLLAYYDFQRDEDDPRDESGCQLLRNRAKNGPKFDGRLLGAVKWTQGRFPGKHALRFGESQGDGVRLNIPVECKQITVAAWVNLQEFSKPYVSLLVSDGWGQAEMLHWHLIQAGEIAFAVGGVTNPVHGEWSPSVFRKEPLGRWRFLAVSCDPAAGKIEFYCDGVLVGQRTVPPSSTAARLGSAMIGAWDDLGQYPGQDRVIEGRMDELLICNRALDRDTINDIYQAGKP